MKKTIIFSIALLATYYALGQSAVPASGGTVQSSEGMFSFSLGQPFAQSDFETAVSVNNVTAFVIEGVQQPFTVEQLSIEGVTSLPFQLSVFPNPTTGFVTVEVIKENNNSNNRMLSFFLYGMEGKMLQKGSIDGSVQLNMESYVTGTYMLSVTDENGSINVYKIIKIN